METARILVVEDEGIVAMDIQRRLQRLGHTVAGIVSDGTEAVALARRTALDLVLMDIQLSGEMDGIEAATQIRQFTRTPVIFITAFTDAASIERAKEIQPYGYILKPFQERELAISIEMALYKSRMERTVRENRKWTEATLANISDGVITTDTTGSIKSINPAAEALTGWSSTDAIGQPFDAVCRKVGIARPPGGEQLNMTEVGTELDADIQAISQTGTTETGTELDFCGDDESRWFEIAPRDGSVLSVECTRTVICDENGVAMGHVISLRDVGVLKEQQEHLRRSRNEAERASRARSEFLSTMSHELRTPLNSIIGMADLALELSPEGEQREYLEILKSSADSLLFLISDILDLSKIDAGKMSVERESFDLYELVEEVCENLGVQSHQKGVALNLHISPECPRKTKGDHRKIRRILNNLLGNAVKFTGSGEVRCVVQPVRESPSEPVMLSFDVTDTGSGMPQEMLDEIFRPFTQIDTSATRRHGGTGVGLAITSRLVDVLEGRIRVQSKVGTGSRFQVELPLVTADVPAKPQDGLQDDPLLIPVDAAQSEKVSVSIVTKSSAISENLSRWLSHWRFEPEIFPSLFEFIGNPSHAKNTLLLVESSLLRAGTEEERNALRESVAGKTSLVLLSRVGADELAGGSSVPHHAVLRIPAGPLQLSEVVRSFIKAGAEASGIRAPGDSAMQGIEQATVLLVEDERVNRLANEKALEKLGYRVVVAEDGTKAVEIVRSRNIDVILMDIEMPVMNGIEAAMKIRNGEAGERQKKVPIIALTAHAMGTDKERARAAGMEWFLTKPFSRNQLCACLEAAVQRNAVNGAAGTELGDPGYRSTSGTELQADRTSTHSDATGSENELVRAYLSALGSETDADAAERLTQHYRDRLRNSGRRNYGSAFLRILLAYRRGDTKTAAAIRRDLARSSAFEQ